MGASEKISLSKLMKTEYTPSVSDASLTMSHNNNNSLKEIVTDYCTLYTVLTLSAVPLPSLSVACPGQEE